MTTHVFGVVDPDAATRISSAVDPAAATKIMVNVDPDAATRLMDPVPHDAPTIIMGGVLHDAASKIMAVVDPDAVTRLMPAVDPGATTQIMSMVLHDAATQIIGAVNPDAATQIMPAFDPDAVTRLMPAVDPGATTQIMGKVPPDAATQIIGAVNPDAATQIMAAFDPDAATIIMNPQAEQDGGTGSAPMPPGLRGMALHVEAPAAPSEPATAAPTQEAWSGAEPTMALGSAPRAPAPAQPGWEGAEPTMAGVPSAAAAAQAWSGADVTSAGLPVSAQPAAASAPGPAGAPWQGSEVTVPNLSADTGVVARATGAKGAKEPGADATGQSSSIGTRAEAGRTITRTGTGTGAGLQRTRQTSVSFDEAWQLEGREGPFTNQQWGDWILGGILGEGGMGTVYRGKQISLKRRVAIKVLAPKLAAEISVLQRFQLEARMTSVLSSPNVVQVYAAGEWEGNHFFVMEFVEGTDLYHVIRERQAAGRPYTPDEAASIVMQAAKGLTEAGRYGMVHRDIKPPNLMVTKDGLIKIADFGIVKVMGESSLTMAGQSVGTPSYVSPEQGRGAADIDQRSDIYSLGVVFYELLCGKKPFEGSTPNALIYQHCYAEPDLPRSVNPLVSEAYQAVVLKCLQKKPVDRYQSAQELFTDLESITSGNALKSALENYRLGTGAEEAQRENLSWAQRHLVAVMVAAVLILLLLGGGLLLINQHNQTNRQLAANLRNSLIHLDRPEPIPNNAEADLKVYAGLPGVDQAKVTFWKNKIKRVEELRQRLSPLDQSVVALAVRLTAVTDLHSYQDLVGTSDPAGQRWQRKVDTLITAEAALRSQLHSLDLGVLTESLRESMSGSLENLRVMVGDHDPQVERLRRQFADYDARKAELLKALAVLDASGSVITEAQRAQLQADLTSLTLMLGAQDERIANWSIKLASSGRQMDQLRQRLSKFDSVELPPMMLQMELDKDLRQYQQLASPADPDLRGWLAKIANASAEADSLRMRLGLLAKVQMLSVAEVDEAEHLENSLATLVGPGDPAVKVWRARIHDDRAKISDLTRQLACVQHAEALTVDEIAKASVARDQFDLIGGLSREQSAAIAQRLDLERAQIRDRAQRLTELDRVTPITANLRQDLTSLEKQYGAQHPDIKRWRAKVDAVDALRQRLSPLDSPSPIADDIAVVMTQLEKLTGDQDPDSVRWQGKVKRIEDLRARLTILDQPADIPTSAQADLQALRDLVGPADAVVERWQRKVDRAKNLATHLQLLWGRMALSPAQFTVAGAEFDELARLIGTASPLMHATAMRLDLLAGPGKPGWASQSGRDEHGIFADLDVGGIKQRFRFVPSGHFVMGSPADEAGRDGSEQEVPVIIAHSFWMADSECTQGLWSAIMPDNPSRDRGAKLPVERISWEQCHAFAKELSQRVGKQFQARLPSEAEWEYACRAGSTTAIPPADNGQPGVRALAWYDDNANGVSHEVRQRNANALGLFDMLGNVSEWCEDRFGAYPTATTTDPLGKDGADQVIRGGAWGDGVERVRSADRESSRASLQSAYVGMRIAVTVVWPDGREPDGSTVLAAVNSGSRSIAQFELPIGIFRVEVKVDADEKRPARALPALSNGVKQ